MYKKILINSVFFVLAAVLPAAGENSSIEIGAGYDSNYNDEKNKKGSVYHLAGINGIHEIARNKDVSFSLGLEGSFRDYKDYENRFLIKPFMELSKETDFTRYGTKLFFGISRNENDEENDYNSWSASFFIDRVVSPRTDFSFDLQYTRFNYENLYSDPQPESDTTFSAGYHGGRSVTGQNMYGSGGNSSTYSSSEDTNTSLNNGTMEKERADHYSLSLFLNHFLTKKVSFGEGIRVGVNNSNIDTNSYNSLGGNLFLRIYPVESFFAGPDLSYYVFDYNDSDITEKLFSAGFKTGYYYKESTMVYLKLFYDKLDSDDSSDNFNSLEIECGISFFI